MTDNPALYHAASQCQVIAVYLLYPKQWTLHGDSPNKLWFWMQNLEALKDSLQALNIPLIICDAIDYNNSADHLLALASHYQCSGVWFNNELGLNEERRDLSVQDRFNENSLECHRYNDQTLLVPGTLLNGKNDYYKVFTPFKKALCKQFTPDVCRVLPAPDKQLPITIESSHTIDCSSLFSPLSSEASGLFPVSEQQAQQRLKVFIEQRSTRYKEDRDFPAITGTSTLSPYLVAGVLSIRQCFQAALQANHGELDTGNSGLTCWMNELIWKEFYKHVLHGFPRLSQHKAFNLETERLPWSNNESHFNAWCRGETGYPIVDAAMKQLVATGWMHNRLRMVVAMFLTKNLFLDWRLGEAFFMKHLIDGDLSANNGGWQWSASTGTDAAPYFRMFNPVNQSERFDPDGLFIREWLPQLSHLDNLQIHAPWQHSAPLLDYPAPIVDHKESRESTLSAFKLLKNSYS
jgi:deoxyribodipyrimidine photo-lyase